MCTTKRENNPFLNLFKDRRKRSGHRIKHGAFPATWPYLRIIRFHGARTVNKKRELLPGLSPTSADSFALPLSIRRLVPEYYPASLSLGRGYCDITPLLIGITLKLRID
jgi:hypothetical protein